MKLPIIDLHCDLLAYLEESPHRSANDRVAHCSIPQLKEGNVKSQVFAVFTKTGMDSVHKGYKQIEIFQDLVNHHFTEDLQALLAIENASGLFNEKEPLEKGLQRLRALDGTSAKPLYISLTWNMENRFGGGNATFVGLKDDGRYLLEALHGRGIAVDLSHTSDKLADGILDYISNKNLSIPLLASHSNARSVLNHPRNLPDAFAKEIIRREGLIGLNFYRPFVGKDATGFLSHIEHWLELGAEKNICFGADFFYEGDAVLSPEAAYFSRYQDATCYAHLLELFQQKLGLSENLLIGMASQNARHFIESNNNNLSLEFF